MKSRYVRGGAAQALQNMRGSMSTQVLGRACDATIGWQRCGPSHRLTSLSPGFSRAGAHIEYSGGRITFVDFGRAEGCINTRLGFYLPAPAPAASSEHASLKLTALRLPAPIDVWGPNVVHEIVTELDDLAASALALGVASGRMRD